MALSGLAFWFCSSESRLNAIMSSVFICRIRKARMIDNRESEADVPEALQQKSSALVPPTTSNQMDISEPATTEPQQTTAAAAAPVAAAASASSLPSTQPSNTSSTSSEKMEVDSDDKKSDVDSKKLSLNSTASATETSSSSASSSTASASKPGLASESISPGLAAASLVAVCSSPQEPLQGTPLASVSGSQQSSFTESKSLPSNSDKEQSVGDAPSEASKVDVDSKVPDVKPEGDATSNKGAEKKESVDLKSTKATLSDTNVTTNDPSQRLISLPKQPAQLKLTLNVESKPKEETKLQASSSPPVSQTASQGTPTQAAPLHGTSTPTTSSITTPQVVTKTPSTEPSEKPSKAISKGTSQGASPAVLHEPPKTMPQGTLPLVLNITKQPPLATSASLVHIPQPTTASSSTGQPLKTVSTKPLVTSETHRSAPIKTFQHLPAGMTAASSKQFSSVIPSVSSKETNKDSKTDPVKSQDQSSSTKL